MSSHETEVVHHITAGQEVSQDSNIQYQARCKCGWRSEPEKYEAVAMVNASHHELEANLFRR